jgi:beta-aspartyl-peptidase (threonine type)
VKARILVHGGAGGWDRTPGHFEQALAACAEAALAGARALDAGGAALDAVEAAVRALEGAPVLNAGRGSYRNTAGEIEMDALIMDGATRAAGAVAAVRDVANPVSLARRVMEDTPHVLLVGPGAEAFADSMGFPRCDTSGWRTASEAAAGDTVGAVALDPAGRLAVAGSTGGVPRKLPGRVGDTPVPGAGAYATRDAAVACTGDGEAFLRLVVAKHACDAIAAGAATQAACDAALALVASLGATGGIIAIDASGEVGAAFNTAAMPCAWVDAAGTLRTSPAGPPSP